MASPPGNATEQGKSAVRKRWFAVTLVLALLAIAVAAAVLLVHSPVRWQHNRFKVLTVKVSHGTNHTIFNGNQTEGRIRTTLRHVGMPVKSFTRDGVITPKVNYAFMVRYCADFPDRQVSAPRAELVDQAGRAIPLRWNSGGYSPSEKVYLSVWLLDATPVPDEKLTLRLKLKRTDTKLAEIAIGRLKNQ